MSTWLPGISPDDVARVEIVRVVVSGSPSAVTRAEFRVVLLDGCERTAEVGFAGKAYQTLADDVAALNALLLRQRHLREARRSSGST